MANRFFEVDDYLKRVARRLRSGCATKRRNGSSAYPGRRNSATSYQSSVLAMPFSAADRSLVILIENGGVDLGIPELASRLLGAIPQSDLIPDDYKQKLVEYIRQTLKKLTDNLLETLELSINRYNAAKPEYFGDVVTLRDGTSSYDDLKNKLLDLSRNGRIIDLFVLTHGRADSISVPGGVTGDKIRAMKSELGSPLTIRSVYMMNCVGSSLNQAWIDAGAKVSSGAIRNNYLPEPTMFFFWKNWKAGQTFESAVTSAYRQTINVMNDAVRNFLSALPIPGSGLIASQFNIEEFDFVKDSAPVIQGQRSVTITTDDLSFTQTMSSSLATTVLPLSVLQSLRFSAAKSNGDTKRTLSPAGVDFIKGWEGFVPKLYNDPVGHCTVGYGTLLHTGKCDGRTVEEPYANGITQEKATELLAQKAAAFQEVIDSSVKVGLNQNQYDALVSFVYNIGGPSFKKSTLLRLLNGGDYGAVPTELKKWTKARKDGKLVDLPGLVKRRAGEAELFQKPVAATAQSSVYSRQQNPLAAVIAGIEVGEAVQIGLGAISVVQAHYSASQGSFSLFYDKVQRMLTGDARQAMPGAQTANKSYSRQFLYLGIGRLNAASANVIVEWEGNDYGEIATPVFRRDLSTSTNWSQSSANITISKIDRFPLPQTDPRSWPIVYFYEGTYDPWGNGYFEFSGEIKIDAFGGFQIDKHKVYPRSFAEWAHSGKPEDYVRKGPSTPPVVPAIPQEQIDYLKTRLP